MADDYGISAALGRQTPQPQSNALGNYGTTGGPAAQPMASKVTPFQFHTKLRGMSGPALPAPPFDPTGRSMGPSGGWPHQVPQKLEGPTSTYKLNPEPWSSPSRGFQMAGPAAPTLTSRPPTPGEMMDALHGGSHAEFQMGKQAGSFHDALMNPAGTGPSAAPAAAEAAESAAVPGVEAAAAKSPGLLGRGLGIAGGLAKGAGVGLAAGVMADPEGMFRAVTGNPQRPSENPANSAGFFGNLGRIFKGEAGLGEITDSIQHNTPLLSDLVQGAQNAGNAISHYMPQGIGGGGGSIVGDMGKVSGRIGSMLKGEGDPAIQQERAARVHQQQVTSSLAQAAPKSPDAPVVVGQASSRPSPNPSPSGTSIAPSPAAVSPSLAQAVSPQAAAQTQPDQASDPAGAMLGSALQRRWGSRAGGNGPAIYRSGQMTDEDNSLLAALGKNTAALGHRDQGRAAVIAAEADRAKTPQAIMNEPFGPALLDAQGQQGGNFEGKAAAMGYGPKGQVPAGAAGQVYQQTKYPDMPDDPNMLQGWLDQRKAHGLGPENDPSLAAALKAHLSQLLPGDELAGWQQPYGFGLLGRDSAAKNMQFVQGLR